MHTVNAGAARNTFRENRILAIILTPILLLVGAFFLNMVLQERHDFLLSATWTATPATIESVALVAGRKQSARLSCAYTYVVNGNEYHGTRVGIVSGGQDAAWAEERFKALEKCRKNHIPFAAMVNPRNPAESILFRDDFGGLHFYALLILGAAFLLAPPLGWLLYLRNPLRQVSQYSSG